MKSLRDVIQKSNQYDTKIESLADVSLNINNFIIQRDDEVKQEINYEIPPQFKEFNDFQCFQEETENEMPNYSISLVGLNESQLLDVLDKQSSVQVFKNDNGDKVDKEKIIELNKSVSKLSFENKNLLNELQKINSKSDNMSNETKYEDQIKKLNILLDAANGKIINNEMNTKQMQQKLAQQDILNLDIDKLIKENKLLENKLESLTTENLNLKNENHNHKIDIHKLKTDINKLKIENENVIAQNNDLRNDINRMNRDHEHLMMSTDQQIKEFEFKFEFECKKYNEQVNFFFNLFYFISIFFYHHSNK
jgi:hypothetical protein